MQKLRSNPNKLLKAAAAALVLLAIAVSLTAYPMPARAQALSTDATLSALTVSPRDITGFSSVRFAYDVGVASTVTEATITATATNSNADVSFDTPDSNDMTDGHQVALSAGRNEVTITVTAENGSDEQDYTVNVNLGVTDNYGWNAGQDLDGLTAAENQEPAGIWGNGATFWVSDVEHDKLYAYNADGTRDASQDFNTLAAANNDTPGGIWSNGVTMWVADNSAGRLFAYRMSDKQRDSAKDFTNLATGNGAPSDLWSDGTTMWVSDLTTDQIFAYRMSDRQPDATRGFTSLDADSESPGGIWSDGLTMWVGDYGDDKLYAYDMTSRARLESRDFNTLEDANNGQPEGIWSDGTTMWVADYNDHKVYAYNMPPSNDNRLSSLTVSPKNIIGFAADRTSYQVGVASTVTQATITATANHANATVDYSGTDADAVAVGHQVALSDGRNEVTITVTAEDSSTQDYTISINRGVTTPAGWKASDDLDGLIAAGNIRPGGIYANDTTAWVLNRFNPKKIFGYSRSTGARDTTKDFDIDATNPHDMWSDGTTLWVAERDGVTSNLRAYTLATGTPLPSQDFENLTAAGNTDPFGVWSDGTTMWVADSSDTHLYAYDRVTKVRQMDKELSLSGFAWNNIEIDPDGFWMDDTTIWVSAPGLGNDFITLVRAIKRSDGSRDTSRDIPVVAAGSDGAQGIWADDETMLIVDGTDDKVYSFNLPEAPSTDATLSALTLSPRDIIGFDAERTSYQVGVASTVAEATVAATANDANADVSFDPQDSNDMTDGHQVALVAGRNSVTVTVTAEDGSTQDYTVNINRGVKAQYGWNADEDLDGLIAAGNRGPRGIWGNSTTFYISDFDGDKVYAYNRDGTRDDTKDFDTTGSTFPNGIWSDGTTLWVADSGSTTLFAYTLSNGNRNTGAEITLANPARGVWGNSTTIWAVNETTDKLEAYQRSDGTDDNDKDITLHADNGDPAGIWSDDTTIWVADHADDKLYAYTLSNGDRDSSKDIDTSGSGNENPRGLWGEGETIWVTDEDDDKVYSYNLQDQRNSDATLSDLITSPRNILRFDADRTAYEVGVASTVAQATVRATPNDATATVDYSGTDADLGTDGHQVALSAGRNLVTITVTAEDSSTQDYTVSVNRGVTDDYGWKADDDLDGLIAAENQGPVGIWDNGATFWVADLSDDKLYAYNADGTRDASQDFNSLAAAQNTNPGGIWSDGVTMWVADNSDGRIFAYRMSDKQRDNAKEFTNLAADNSSPSDLWSDGTTMWVSDLINRRIFAYNMSDKQRNDTRDFSSLDSENGSPSGIWSDRVTMWVADYVDDKLYAYDMASRARLESRDFDTLEGAGNGQPEGIWSDGTTMWVADDDGDKVYSYNMPPSNDARLSDLTVSPKNLIGFATDRTSYEVGVASAVAQATVTGTPANPNARVDYSGTDASSSAGHQINLSDGRNAVTITVTAEDSSTQAYTININQGVTDALGWNADQDLDGFIGSEVFNPTGIASDGSRFYITTQNDLTIFAFNYLGLPDATRNITPASDNGNPTYMWADATTLFVVDPVDLRVYAYQLSDGARQMSREFGLRTDNANPTGIWSNDVTAWIADTVNHKLYAYSLAGRVSDDDKNIDLDGDNTDPAGVASNGATIWVADATDQKVYAYELQGGGRVVTKEINTLVNTGNTAPSGMWAGQETIWINDAGDSKTYTYNLPPARTPQQVAADATLSALTVAPKNIVRFDPEDTSYEVGVASTVTEATVSATPNAPNAMAFITPADSNAVTEGHQVNLSAGRNPVTIRVTSQDGTILNYTVSINRGVTDNFGWKADEDLDGLLMLETGNLYRGIAENNGIFWISAYASRTLAAYQQDGSRLPARDIDLHSSHQRPTYLWTNGQTIWVSDSVNSRLHAYQLSDGIRQQSRDIALHADNGFAVGIWSDGTTIWVADDTDDKLYAYALDGGARQESNEFDLHSSNNSPSGLWSDGYNMWVADSLDDKLYAYFLETGQRRGRLDFNTLSGAGNTSVFGATSSGTTMWVLDPTDRKVYSYNLILSDDRTLSALTVSPKDIIGFDAERDSYQLGVDSTVTRATVTATANHPGARVTFTPPDASSGTRGHQVDLSAGRNPVTVTVTAEDGTTQDYTLSINRGVADDFGWNAGNDLDGLATTTDNPVGAIAEHDGIFWIAPFFRGNVLAYRQDGSRLPSRDISRSANANITYMFTDGQTIWAADGVDHKLYAYQLSDDSRQEPKDITLHTDNAQGAGIWSDGTTMWVADNTDHKLYAYSLDGGVRQQSREFDLASGNDESRGIWSDGNTVWVTDSTDQKLYAYTLQDGDRQTGRDFNTLQAVGNTKPLDITSGSNIMWVTDTVDNKVYSYNMPLLPPANLQPAIGDRRIAITWDDPQRSAITGYQYRVSSDDAVSWNPDWTTMPGSNARTTTFTVRNLANTFEHVIEVRALEGAKSSGAARFAATPMGPPSMPLMPENLDTVAGDQTIYLSWHKPVEDPRAPVTSFDARYRPYGSSRSWRNATSVSVEQTPRTLYNQTIEGLDNRQPYEVQAAAVNSVGRSEWATASAVPQADFRYGPPSDDGNETLDLGPLHASWTDRLNSDTFHPDQKPLNINVIENSCMAPATFRIFWDVQDKAAKEYEADIQTREGAGEVTHQFGTETFIYANTRYEQGYIYGTASLHKSSTLSVRVRARFKPEGWSTWSETANLFCFETDTPATSQEQAGTDQQSEADNSPATGQPTVTGRAEVGETLTASTGGITDPDGLASAAFSYQWARHDGSTNTDISGATTSTYTLQEEDLDLRVSVTVSFTDDGGNDETSTSAAVHVQPPTPLSGAFDSATLPSEHDGSNAFTFEIHFSEEPVLGFEAVRDHVLDVTNGDVASVRRTTQGSNLRWEITVQPDGNDEVTLLLPITANCGDAGAVCTGSEKKLLIGAAVFVRGPATSQEQTAANTPATGNPAITGTARVGQTLSAATSGIADADGLQDATFSYQWVAGDGVTDTDIPGETGAAYVVRPGDAGKMIKVRVSFTDDEGNEETLTSAATAAVAATFPGTPRSLQVQTGGTGELALTWQEPESNGGSEVTGYRVQWKLAAGSWDTEADVSSATATGTSHTIGSLSLDTEYAVRVIATNSAGDGPPSAERTETARARASEQRDSTPNTAATGAPTISGKAQVGQTLTADTGGVSDENGLEDASFSYQWLRGDGTSDANISGATASTYTVHNDDAGKSIRVRVSFTDDDGNDESLTSEAAAVPVPTPLTGAFDAGAVPASHDGSTAFTLEFFFNKEPSLEEAAVRDHVLTVVNGAVTSASRTTQGSALRWEITVQPDGHGDVTVTLPRTTGCADPGAVCTRHGQMLSNKISTTISGPEPPPAPTGLTGTINDNGTITLSWTAPEDDSVTGYQVLRRRPQWGEGDLEVYVDDTGSHAATYTDTNTVEPTRYVYRVKARNAAGLSEWSNFVKIDK